jgi:hypothetical protein
MTLSELIAIGVIVNTLLNGIWIFVVSRMETRIHRLESLFMNKAIEK